MKYNDFNQNGHFDPFFDPDDPETGLAGWNFSVYYLSDGSYTGMSQLTNSQGTFLFSGLDENTLYLVKENLSEHPGWYNFTPTELIADFKNTTEYPGQSIANSSVASQLLPGNNIAFASRSLWGTSGNYHQDIEWNPFSSSSPAPLNQTRDGIHPYWANDTQYDFILSYDPNDSANAINYTVIGPVSSSNSTIVATSITGPANLTGTRYPIDMIDIYTRANTPLTTFTETEVSNLVLTSDGKTYTINNNSVAINQVGTAQTHLIIRADRVLGTSIATNGFTLTGQQKFAYNATIGIDPDGLAIQINVGKDNIAPFDVIQEFGNFQHQGEIEGTKYSDDNGNSIWERNLNETVLKGWTIRISNSSGWSATDVSDENGEYEFYVPYGPGYDTYHVEEISQPGFLQTQGKNGYDFTLSDGHAHITDVDFGNQPVLTFNVTGYKWNDLNGNGKRDPGEPGLEGWIISLKNDTFSYYATTTTDATGNYSFTYVPKGIYTLNETPKEGWKNITSINQTICVPQFPYLPPPSGPPEPDMEVFYQSGGTPIPGTSPIDYAYFSTQISHINPSFGYDITNTQYPGWCADTSNTINPGVIFGPTYFIDTTPPFPSALVSKYPQIANSPWDKVNYVLNVRKNYSLAWGAQNTSNVVQAVLWNLTNNVSVNVPTGGISLNGSQQAGALALIADANANGTNFTPSCGGVKGILVNISLSPTKQLTMIEVPVRCCGLPVNFGNQQLGTITGYKNDSVTGSGLSWWNITLTNSSIGYFAYNITNSSGGYNFTNIPYGIYWLNETPQAGYTQSIVTPNKTVTVNRNNLTLFYNFTNIQQLGNLSGYKVNETGWGLSGWTINLTNLTQGTPAYNTTTVGDGSYSFTEIPWGEYWLNETPQAGWVQSPSTPNRTIEINGTSLLIPGQYFNNTQQLGNVSGYKVNGTGTGLGEWTITLTNQTTGTPNFTNTTDASGLFSFTEIPWGLYWLNETPKAGWTQFPSTPNRTIEINGTSLLVTTQNFTNQPSGPTYGNISGYKLKSPGLTPLGGWNITLYYENGTLAGSRKTSGSGAFYFDPLPLGNYTLNETPQAGWTQTGPAGGLYLIQLNGSNPVVINQNFTNNQTLGNISGYKLNASTGIGLSNWNIILSNGTIPYFSSTLTNGSGGFNFTNIPWGIYLLSEIPQAGWTQSPLTPNRTVEINGTSLVLVNRNFTNQLNPVRGNISGSKYNDLNGNGIKEINDVPIPGVVIKLYYQNGTLFGTRTTDSNGAYVFDPVPAGIYSLNETVPSGWQQKQPAGGNYSIQVNATSFNFTRLFGNQQIPNPCSCPTNAYFTWSVVRSKPHTIQFTDATSGNPVYWYYEFGNGKFSLSRNPLISYASAGTYTVKLSAKGCDCSGNTYWTYYSTRVQVP
ncbi:MAG TPA: SdrD B-like domain-containing protein [Methanoregulaceae archaeon]|nr:SdrD B-like domain-containing protein [Methanoregulaceae archaeon]